MRDEDKKYHPDDYIRNKQKWDRRDAAREIEEDEEDRINRKRKSQQERWLKFILGVLVAVVAGIILLLVSPYIYRLMSFFQSL